MSFQEPFGFYSGVVAQFFLSTQKRQKSPVQFAEMIFERMASQLLHDSEVFILLCACCKFEFVYDLRVLKCHHPFHRSF
jgi:hypothetical protein